MRDPIVIDPPGFDQKAGWDECKQYVEDCGGLAHEDGEPNWRAAFGADPGVCSCPCCDQFYWAWGNKQRCAECGFEFPTHWWADYSYGAQARQRADSEHLRPKLDESNRKPGRLHEQRMQQKYYRFAFEHACVPSMEAAKTIAWRTFFPEDDSRKMPLTLHDDGTLERMDEP